MSTTKPPPTEQLDAHLVYLKLVFIREHFASLAEDAARTHQGHVEYLARLIEGEALLRQERSVQRRIQQARFPVIKITSALLDRLLHHSETIVIEVKSYRMKDQIES